MWSEFKEEVFTWWQSAYSSAGLWF